MTQADRKLIQHVLKQKEAPPPRPIPTDPAEVARWLGWVVEAEKVIRDAIEELEDLDEGLRDVEEADDLGLSPVGTTVDLKALLKKLDHTPPKAVPKRKKK